ncbi:MAG: Prolyl oligopeptidase [Mycobacterium sp.]|nr:Prolyl oligopeptidase [Mycobacterium sp.]
MPLPRALRYPPAEPTELVEDLAGHRVPDPYRWLEDATDPRTVAWSAGQEALAREVLDALPGRDATAARLRALLGGGSVGVPVWRGGRAFSTRRRPADQHPVLLWRDGEALARPVVDPGRLDPSGATTLDAWSPSRDGRFVAHQLSVGGDEEPLLRVVDVASGEVVDGPITRCRYAPVAWLPQELDGAPAFFYVRSLAPHELTPDDLARPAGAPPADPETEAPFHRRLWLHRVGTPTSADVRVRGLGDANGIDTAVVPGTYFGLSVSADGRWLVVSSSVGTAPRTDVWLADLAADDPGRPRLVPVIRGADAETSAAVGWDGQLWLSTDLGAPRGRLCVADPAAVVRGDVGPADWETVLPEDPTAVLAGHVLLRGPAGPAVLALRTRHAAAELTLHAADGTAGGTTPVPVPGLGSVAGLTARPEGGTEAWFGWTDATTPSRVHRFDLATGRTTVWADAPGAVAPPPVTTTVATATSADGTTVRMTVLAPAGGGPGPRPTVLYGYGGFGVPMSPGYSATALAWVAAGGVWAVAQLRGGSEEGEDWHRAGMRERKQNVFDDLHACARALRDGGTAGTLGIVGGSNGGLLVGAALTQRPELYDAVVCSAPLLDMVRYELFGLGRTWNDEYGTAADAEELGWLLSYSPYHRAVAAAAQGPVAWPAVLFTTFEGDTRVDPLHARKLAAALQAGLAPAAGPVLLRRESDVGHGARSVDRTVGLAADQLVFLAAALGQGTTPGAG